MNTQPHPAKDVSAEALSQWVRTRRSVRDFATTPIPQALLDAVLADANHAPSWSNTQPYRIAVASGPVRDRLARDLSGRFDKGMAAQNGGWLGKAKLLLTRDGLPDGDYTVNFEYPQDLQPQRRATGHGLYQLLRIGRKDHAAREAQMRRNFEFFGAPTAIFVFVHGGLGPFSALDAGIYIQTLMLSAHAHGLGTCAQGALATWGGPVRAAFDVPKHYKLLCGLSIGYASDHAVNLYNPGRQPATDLQLPTSLSF
jgi:nitroreductase